MLFDGHTRDTIGSVFKDVNFVVFNYDRCIEQFLTIALMRRFNIEQGRARDLVAGCSIVHPYGKVGELREAHSGGVPYGGLEGADFAQVASSIKTYTESMEEQTAGVVKDSVAAAQTLVFMGFGWLGQNVELLDTGHRETKAEKVFATTMGMPPGEVEVVVDRINAIVHRGRYNTSRTELGTLEVGFVNDNGDCGALMRNCWLRLTGG